MHQSPNLPKWRPRSQPRVPQRDTYDSTPKSPWREFQQRAVVGGAEYRLAGADNNYNAKGQQQRPHDTEQYHGPTIRNAYCQSVRAPVSDSPEGRHRNGPEAVDEASVAGQDGPATEA